MGKNLHNSNPTVIDNFLYDLFIQYAYSLLILKSYRDNFRIVSSSQIEKDNRPLFNKNKHSVYSPELTKELIELLQNENVFTKEELVSIINTLILENYSLEDYQEQNN